MADKAHIHRVPYMIGNSQGGWMQCPECVVRDQENEDLRKRILELEESVEYPTDCLGG